LVACLPVIVPVGTMHCRFTLPNLAAAARLLAFLASFATWYGSAAFAQPRVPTITELAADAGSDRIAKLIEGAKKEGTLTVYSSATVEDLAALTAAFTKKYGVKVRVWRGSSENIVQRAVAEARGGRFDVDVIETGALAMESMQREKLFQEVKTSALSELVPAAILPHREWIGTRFNVFAASYNTKLVKHEELPKSYQDLLDPRWKGKLGMEAEDSDWFGAVVSELGEERGLKLFRDIVAANGISVRKGHTLLANLVVSGEVPFALTTYAYKVEQLRKSGAPLAWLVIPPGVARFEGAAVARGSPHPHGAILFFEFMLTDGQDVLRNRDFFPASRKAAPLPSGVSLTFIDPAKGLDENQKWSRYFRDVITHSAR
jgi:iron(III) transport system substrate-binding protein